MLATPKKLAEVFDLTIACEDGDDLLSRLS